MKYCGYFVHKVGGTENKTDPPPQKVGGHVPLGICAHACKEIQGSLAELKMFGCKMFNRTNEIVNNFSE